MEQEGKVGAGVPVDIIRWQRDHLVFSSAMFEKFTASQPVSDIYQSVKDRLDGVRTSVLQTIVNLIVFNIKMKRYAIIRWMAVALNQ